MYWQANKGFFTEQNILAFADQNSWQIVDSVVQLDVSNWVEDGEMVFPLSQYGFTPELHNNSVYKNFPRWIKSKAKVYMFKTKLLVFEAGTDECTDINGFILLADERNEMSVYHIWGE